MLTERIPFDLDFRAIGLDAHKELGLMPLDPMYRLVFGAGGHIDATSNLEEMTERIRDLSGDKNATGFENYVKQNRNKLDFSKQCLQTPWSSPLNVFAKRAIRVATILKPWSSVAGDLSKHFDDQRVRLAMSFQTKYLGIDDFHIINDCSFRIERTKFYRNMSFCSGMNTHRMNIDPMSCFVHPCNHSCTMVVFTARNIDYVTYLEVRHPFHLPF